MMQRLKNSMGLFLTGALLCASLIEGQTLHAKEVSLFDMKHAWQTDSGKNRQLKDFKGKKTFLTMAYTNCHSACPLVVESLKKLSDEAQAKKMDVQFVIVSLDPERDQWQSLQHFKTNMKIDRPGWMLMVGDEANTRRLSVAIGLHYSKVPDSTEIMHDNLIVLLDEEGRMVRKVEGLKAKLADFSL